MEKSLKNFLILDKEKYKIIDICAFSGCSYDQEPPIPIQNKFNVLLVHRMIIEEKLWSAQENYVASNIFLRQNNFDLIVSGDNHRGFISEAHGKRLLVNCGAMMRSKIDQVNHKPFVVLYDTDTRKYQQIFIPIEPADKVFRMEKVVAEKERNTSLESFVAGISEQKEVGLLFEDNLQEFAKANPDVDSQTMGIIYWSMGKEGYTNDGKVI
jgi:predicted phosphodiesterase